MFGLCKVSGSLFCAAGICAQQNLNTISMKKRNFEWVGALENETISDQVVALNNLTRSHVRHAPLLTTKRKRVETIGACFEETRSGLASETRVFERIPPQKRGRLGKMLNAIDPSGRRKKSKKPPSFASVKRESLSPTQISAMDMLMDTNNCGNCSATCATSTKVLDAAGPVRLASNCCFADLISLEKPNIQGMNISR